jgi:type I restriction enzyme S subunit
MRIKEICEYGIKSNIKAGEALSEGEVKFFTSSSESNKYVNKEQFTRPGIIMGTGGNATLHYCDKPFSVSTDCIVLFPKINLSAKYLYYYFKSNFHILQLGFKGAGLKHTSKKYINEISIRHIPSIEKQLNVVAILDKIEEVITKKNQQLAEYDQLIKSRFVEMFGDPIEKPDNYKYSTYGKKFYLNAGGTPSKIYPEYWEGGNISWIGSNLCQNVVIYENDGKFITEQGYKNSSATLFPVDTVLIALVGATIGKVALLKFETTTNQNVLGVRGIKEAGYNPYFVYMYTQGLYKKFIEIGNSGFNMATKTFISKLFIPEIDINLQNEYADFFVQVEKLKNKVQQSLNEKQKLFDALVQEYFG